MKRLRNHDWLPVIYFLAPSLLLLATTLIPSSAAGLIGQFLTAIFFTQCLANLLKRELPKRSKVLSTYYLVGCCLAAPVFLAIVIENLSHARVE